MHKKLCKAAAKIDTLWRRSIIRGFLEHLLDLKHTEDI